jgi:FkbM family methyltransferase
MILRTLNTLPIWRRELQVFGHALRAPSFDRLASLWLHKLGAMGAEEKRVLSQLVSPGMTVVDVGANQGIYTLFLAELAKPGKVFAFEPEPRLYQSLIQNVKENGLTNVTCHQMAVSRISGTLRLQSQGINSGDNRIVREPTGSAGIKVSAKALDEIFADRRIDFVKMDIQGWEAEALAGARRALERNRDVILMLEFWPYGLLQAGAEPQTLLTTLHKLGFGLWRLRHGSLHALPVTPFSYSKHKYFYFNIVAARDLSRMKSRCA